MLTRHLLYENCFKKASESTKMSPFCKRDVLSNQIRNKALEEDIENEARKDVCNGSSSFL